MEIGKWIRERLKPRLKIDPKIVTREEKFESQDPKRRQWMLDHTYLSSGGLEQLKQHPDWPTSLSVTQAWIERTPRGRAYGPVEARVSFDVVDDRTYSNALNQLKRELYLRGCNAGIRLRTKERGKHLTASAIASIIDRGL